jgi:TnpA family transposase
VQTLLEFETGRPPCSKGLRHCTDMIQRQYLDSHGQSEVAFALSHLPGFELLPRLKGIARQRLLPAGGG